MAKQVREEAFRVMCDMWGVDAAISAAKSMGVAVSTEQIEAERKKEHEADERWKAILKPKEK